MNITFTSSAPDAASFKALYDTTGWGPQERGSDFYRDALGGTWASVAAYDGKALIGFARVISDGKLHAFITEMIVHPTYQGRTIGERLLASLVETCRAAGIDDIQLFCASGKAGFYLKSGFVKRADDAPGMQYDVSRAT